jgi:peroxiredoxin Q/BCP
MRITLLVSSALIAIAAPADAALKLGSRAPQFVTQGALAGKIMKFDLAQALAKGPVVLYFYPKAFTKGCTLEAHAFSESMGQFKKAGATVIGLSADDLPTLKKFSVEECRNAFPVGIASKQIIKNYDVSLPVVGAFKNMTSRTSYVIDTSGRIVMAYDAMDWSQHVAKSLAAVEALKK